MITDWHKKEYFSAIAFCALLMVALIMSLCHLKAVVSSLETPALVDLTRGKWAPQFESAFREAMPVNTPSRNFWGRAEYALFHQGRKGVVVGSNGWLFTDEEFSCPAQYKKNLAENLAYITNTQKTLAQKNVQLAVVLVPAKARVFPEYLGDAAVPSCRQKLYGDIRAFLTQNNIPATDLLPVMQASATRSTLYMKTDTHWSPLGAQLAAQQAANLVHISFKDLTLPVSTYSSQAGAVKTIDGDLTNYMPGVTVSSETIPTYASGVAVASTDTQANLLGDDAPPITLVGTSYSANPNWNFEGFLKEAFKSDILNMADQGLGPFVVMDKYLANDAWKTAPPKLVIWEMPERYFLMPHGVAGK